MNKVVLITGASRGIGRAVALAFAEKSASKNNHEEYNIFVNCAKNSELLENVKKQIRNLGVCCESFTGDISNYNTAMEMFDEVHRHFGNVDILVNNAGLIKRNDAIDFTEDEWDSVIQVNQKMVFFLSQAFAKQYIKQGHGGKIININSMLSYQGGIRVPSYTASKSAGMGLTKAMCNEWACHNINVNAIAPGYMATNNTAQLRSDSDRSEAIIDRIPAGRWGTPDDMKGAVVFLASAASDYVNGFTLAVDGGWLAR